MATIELNRENFAAAVSGEGITLVDFWAAWCGPCLRFGPIFESKSEEHADVTFAKFDTESDPELSGAWEISSIPTLMAFRDGYLVFRQPGALNAAQLEEVISAVKSLNMEKLKAELNQPAEESEDSKPR